MYSTNTNTFNTIWSSAQDQIVADSSTAAMNELRSRTSVRRCPRRIRIHLATVAKCDESSGADLEQEIGGDHSLKPIARDNEIHFSLPSDRRQVRSAVSRLQDFGMIIGVFTEGDRVRVGLALEECLLNAIIHGNLEVSSKLRESDDGSYDALVEERAGKSPFKDRRVDVVARSSGDAVEFTIRDEGAGFDVASLPDPTDPEHITCVHGRGVLFMRAFMDEVRFNAKGNEVTLNKRKATTVACIPR